MQFDYDRLDDEDAAAHLHEQGSARPAATASAEAAVAATDEPRRVARGRAGRRAARCRRGARAARRRCPRRGRAGGARPGHRSSSSTSTTATGSRARPDDGAKPRRSTRCCRCRDTLVVEGAHRLRRDVRRVAAVLQHAVGRVASASPTTAPPATSRSPSTSAARRSSVGGVVSSEQDFLSRGGVGRRAASSATTATARGRFGVAGTNDRINATNGVASNAPRNTLEFLVGITQALSPNAIVQSNLTYYTGHGYYSDPYKTLDTRPDRAPRSLAWLTRYNQYFAEPDATLKLGYRLLFDSFGSTSNMFEAAWVQALPSGFTRHAARCATTRRAPRTSTSNPPFPQRLRATASTTRRHAARRRSARSPPASTVAQGAAGRLDVSICASTSTARIPTGASAARQPGHPASSPRAGSRSGIAKTF